MLQTSNIRSFLLSFDFTNEEQGLIPIQESNWEGVTTMGKYNAITNEVVFEDGKNQLLKCSDEG